VSLLPDEIFERKGNDLFRDLTISITTAVLGGEVEFDTLIEKIKLKIPAGSEQGKVFKIKEYGISKFRGTGKGDMYVKLKINIPKNLTKEQKEVFESLRKVENQQSGIFDRIFG
jgi:molecular chaperone DnaJ